MELPKAQVAPHPWEDLVGNKNLTIIKHQFCAKISDVDHLISLKSPVIVSSSTSSKQVTSVRTSNLPKVTWLLSGSKSSESSSLSNELPFSFFSSYAFLCVIQQNLASRVSSLCFHNCYWLFWTSSPLSSVLPCFVEQPSCIWPLYLRSLVTTDSISFFWAPDPALGKVPASW